MTYNKPKGITYVEMCIYVDNHIYEEEKDVGLIYEYIYHICYMLACKAKYFRKLEDYDEFSLYMATKVYLRMTDKRQFQAEEGEKPLDKIKSVLNYCKAVLYGTKVDYQNQNFHQVITEGANDGFDASNVLADLKASVQKDYEYDLNEFVIEELKRLPEIIKKVLNKTPYKACKKEYHDLYVSCLLTLLKNFTLCEANKEKIIRAELKNKYKDSMLRALYAQEKETSPTVWQLSPNLIDYVTVLCNIIKKRLSDNINQTRYSVELSDDTIEDIIMSNYNANIGVYEEDD